MEGACLGDVGHVRERHHLPVLLLSGRSVYAPNRRPACHPENSVFAGEHSPPPPKQYLHYQAPPGFLANEGSLRIPRGACAGASSPSGPPDFRLQSLSMIKVHGLFIMNQDLFMINRGLCIMKVRGLSIIKVQGSFMRKV